MENSNLKEVNYVPTNYEYSTTRLKAKNEDKKTDTLFLQFAVITGILLQLECSAFWVWISTAMIRMKSNDANINLLDREITPMEASLLCGIPLYFSSIVGSVLSNLADEIGRKNSLHVLGIAMLISSIGLTLSNHIYSIIIFYTIIQTISSGIWGILPVYITEICEDHNRIKYGCLMSVFTPLGQLYGNVMKLFPSLRTYSLVLAAPLIPCLVCFFFIPESPVYLLLNKKEEECIIVLKMLRSNKTENEIRQDLNEIGRSLLDTRNNKLTESIGLVKLLKRREGRIGLILASLPLYAQYFSGVFVIMPQLAPTFNKPSSKVSADTVTSIVGIIEVITFTITTLIIQKTGRKPLLMVSSMGAGIMVSIIGVYFYLEDHGYPLTDNFHWLPVICVVIYRVFYSFGLGPIPMATMSELFCPQLRVTALSFISITIGLLLTIYTTTFSLLIQNIGIHHSLWIFGFSCFLNTILFAFILPDTKGKSVVEIQEILMEYQVRK
ncbi:facilitated trehalose transporter Tret1-like isoform X1 [Diorhabda carinulata]|uniref:facilitated trehalose transporter Tret1-like isoform X1 n=2 Tax=Diorhabda carinulata TaxID=1163345 RepID=UPI0025A15ADC|nr:facilitated trehalose transporter Tret1-like isoform X1 [Diorhabda carinulata]